MTVASGARDLVAALMDGYLAIMSSIEETLAQRTVRGKGQCGGVAQGTDEPSRGVGHIWIDLRFDLRVTYRSSSHTRFTSATSTPAYRMRVLR